MPEFDGRGRGHDRGYASQSSLGRPHQVAERTLEEKANDAARSCGREVDAVEAALHAVENARAENDPAAWKRGADRLTSAVTHAERELERARAVAAASSEAQQRLADIAKTFDGLKLRAENIGEAPRGWVEVSREAEILSVLSAPLEGGAQVGFARKEEALRAELSQLSVAESRALTKRLRSASDGDAIAAVFKRLVPERRQRILDFLDGARRREALQAGQAKSSQLSSPATSRASASADASLLGSYVPTESPLQWQPDSIIVEKPGAQPAHHDPASLQWQPDSVVATKPHDEAAPPLVNEGGMFGAVSGVLLQTGLAKPHEAPVEDRNKLSTYLLHNHVEAWRTIGEHLNAVALPQPHERLPWMQPALFHSLLLDELAAHVGNFKRVQTLDEVLFPATTASVLSGILPEKMGWSTSVGIALAHALHLSIVGSLRRVGERYVDVADAREPGNTDPVAFRELVLSMPVDRYVGRALCHRDVVTLEPSDPKAKLAKKKRVGLRPITQLAFEGERDPKLWNWIRVEPADATAEEVAAELWKVTDGHGEANASFNAYLLAAAPPLFGVPKRMAIHMKRFSALAARAFAGNAATVIDNDNVDAQLLQLAQSSGATDAASGPRATFHDAPAKLGDVEERVHDCELQLGVIKSRLAPWGLAQEVSTATAFIKQQAHDAATADERKLTDIVVRLDGQKSRLAQIGGALTDLDAASRRAAKDDASDPIREIVQLLALATATSHIESASKLKLDQALQLEITLTARALQATERNMMGAVSYVHQQAGDNLTTGNLSHEALGIQEQSRHMQSQLLAGESVDPEKLEDVSIGSEHVALEARVYGTLDALKDMQDAARKAREGDAAVIASLFSGEFRDIDSLAQKIGADLHPVLGNLKNQWREVEGELKRGLSSSSRKAELRAIRRAIVAEAQNKLKMVSEKRDLQHFFSKASEAIKDQQFRAAIVRAAAFIGISLVAGAAAQFAAAGMASMLTDATAASELSGLGLAAREATIGATRTVVDATLNATGQAALDGLSFSDASEAWAQNLMMTLASNAVFGSIAKVAAREKDLARMEGDLAKTLAKMPGGKLAKAGALLKEAGAITVHTIWGAAMGEVAGRIATGKSHPNMMTMQDWAIQGASVAIGRGISQRMVANRKLHQEIDSAIHETERSLAAQAEHVRKLADQVVDTKSSDLALVLLDEHEAFMRETAQRLDLAIAKSGDPTGKLSMHQAATEIALREAGSAGMLDTRFALAGLEELVPGALWKGTRQDIECAVNQAGRDAKVTAPGESSKRWTIETSDGRRIEIEEAHATRNERDASIVPAEPGSTKVGQLDAVATSLPVLEGVDAATGVTKGAAYESDMAALRQFYAEMETEAQYGVARKGAVQDGQYTWNFGHKAFTFSHGVVNFEFSVYLDGSNVSGAELQHLKQQVHRGIDRHYNATKLSVRGPDGVERRLHLEVIFVDQPGNADINVTAHPGNGYANVYNWFVDGNPTTHAHEVTHGAFGIKDEYHDATGAAPDRATPTSPGVYSEADPGIMSDYWVGHPIRDNTAHPNTEVKQRNLDEISKQAPNAPPKVEVPENQSGAGKAPPSPHENTPVRVQAIAELGAIPVAKLAAGTKVIGEHAPLERDTYYVTPEHGAQMLKSLVALEGDGVQTRVFKKGFIVRRGADEWYFEFHVEAGKHGATPATDARDGHGLPPANAATVELWGFRGVREIHGRPKAEWTVREQQQVDAIKETDPLLYAGHIGISLDGGKTIVGFNPSVPHDVPVAEALKNLFNHEAYPGIVKDDTALFERATQMAKERGWNTEPIVAVELVDKPKKLEMLKEVARLSGMNPGEHGLGFSFPLKQPENGEHFAASKEYPAECVRNCAAFPEKVGVPIPDRSGNLNQYMPQLQNWASEDAPKDFRKKGDESNE